MVMVVLSVRTGAARRQVQLRFPEPLVLAQYKHTHSSTSKTKVRRHTSTRVVLIVSHPDSRLAVLKRASVRDAAFQTDPITGGVDPAHGRGVVSRARVPQKRRLVE